MNINQSISSPVNSPEKDLSSSYRSEQSPQIPQEEVKWAK